MSNHVSTPFRCSDTSRQSQGNGFTAVASESNFANAQSRPEMGAIVSPSLFPGSRKGNAVHTQTIHRTGAGSSQVGDSNSIPPPSVNPSTGSASSASHMAYSSTPAQPTSVSDFQRQPLASEQVGVIERLASMNVSDAEMMRVIDNIATPQSGGTSLGSPPIDRKGTVASRRSSPPPPAYGSSQ
jgi:hypothetical protein